LTLQKTVPYYVYSVSKSWQEKEIVKMCTNPGYGLMQNFWC